VVPPTLSLWRARAMGLDMRRAGATWHGACMGHQAAPYISPLANARHLQQGWAKGKRGEHKQMPCHTVPLFEIQRGGTVCTAPKLRKIIAQSFLAIQPGRV
jgi:hypothetical protein